MLIHSPGSLATGLGSTPQTRPPWFFFCLVRAPSFTFFHCLSLLPLCSLSLTPLSLSALSLFSSVLSRLFSPLASLLALLSLAPSHSPPNFATKPTTHKKEKSRNSPLPRVASLSSPRNSFLFLFSQEQWTVGGSSFC